MSRTKKAGRRKQISTTLEWEYYEYLRALAKKNNIPVGTMAKRVIEYAALREDGAIPVDIDKECFEKLESISKEKGMDLAKVIAKVTANYVNGYF